jgi:hypothetical protein
MIPLYSTLVGLGTAIQNEKICAGWQSNYMSLEKVSIARTFGAELTEYYYYYYYYCHQQQHRHQKQKQQHQTRNFLEVGDFETNILRQ